MPTGSRPRVLLIAEAANPEFTSVPLVGWSMARAIAGVTDAHLVTQVRNAEAIARSGLPASEYTCIDSERLARPAWRLAGWLGGGKGKAWTLTTAIGALTYPYFERLVWRRFGAAIRRGDYDLVHRITPLSPTAPSPLAGHCARHGVPFVLGPLNGGLPWPPGFEQARWKERELLSYVRAAYRLLPGYRSTRRNAAAILVASRATLEQVPARYRERCVYLPENGIDPERFSQQREGRIELPLRIVFVGRLVPYKGADMLLEAVAPLVREGRVTVEILGDGPERERLEALVAEQGLQAGVQLSGWVDHAGLQSRLARAHVLGFPSIREFGGGVVLEAMALGLVPVVVDYGGPAELVTPETGLLVPLGRREELIERFRQVFARLCADPAPLEALGAAARRRIEERFTWEAKAGQVLAVYDWVLGRTAERPDLGWDVPLEAAAG